MDDPGGSGLLDRVKALLAWWARTRPARANARFGAAGGGVLTGGIAYAALFSVFAALTIGFTVFMAVLGGHDQLRDKVVDTVAQALPGLITTPDHDGLIDPTSLHLSGGFTVAGVIAVVALVLAATSAVAALATGVQAMFDVHPQENAVFGKLRQLAGFAGVAFAVLVSAVLSLAVTAAADWLLRLVHLTDGAGLVTRIGGIAVAFAVDAATFVLIVRVLAHVDPPRRDLLGGAAIAATGLGVVRLLGASVVAGSVTKNPLLASFAVIVVLLVWINLVARIVLLAAAWTADPLAKT